MTKAMVDTKEPTVFFWTCDDDGLRLHAIRDEDEERDYFSPPILIAGAVVKVGDRWEDTYEIWSDGKYEGEVKVAAEILGVEDVSVPAGDFADCLKVEVAALDATDDSLYWKETWYLAEDVGLVKVVNSPESLDDDGFFADRGYTRQLLGYHITPSNLTPDEEAIKQLRRDLNRYFEEEDPNDDIPDLYSDNYDSRCQNKIDRLNSFDWTFANNDDLFMYSSIGEIVINGNKAQCIVESLRKGKLMPAGTPWMIWQRTSNHMIKEIDGWKYYGDQIAFQIGWMFAWTRKYSNNDRFLDMSAGMQDCNGAPVDVDSQITSLTVTGPPGTFSDLDLAAGWEPDWLEYFLEEDISQAQNGFYTFRLEDMSGNIYETTDYLVVMPPLDIPTLVSPIDNVTTSSTDVTLDWNPVAGTDVYRVDVDVWEIDRWRRTLRITTPADQADASLAPGTDYRWRVRPRQTDMYEDAFDNESRSDWEYFLTP